MFDARGPLGRDARLGEVRARGADDDAERRFRRRARARALVLSSSLKSALALSLSPSRVRRRARAQVDVPLASLVVGEEAVAWHRLHDPRGKAEPGSSPGEIEVGLLLRR